MQPTSSLDSSVSASRIRLTVCIPTRNRPDLLSRTLASVVPDCPPGVEIIVSDNSKDDASRETCSRWLGMPHTRHRYVKNEPPVGLVENHNLCLERARGEWVLFLHDDDYLLPGGVAAMVDATSRAGDDCKAVLFGVDVVDGAGRLLKRQMPACERNMQPRDALLEVLTNSSFVRVPAIVVRREVYAEWGGFALDVGTAEDFDMWCRIFARHGVRCVPQLTSVYTVHTETVTMGMFDRSTIRDFQRIFERITARGFIDPGTARRCQRRFLHQFILAGAYRHIRRGDRATARRIMKLFDMPEVKRLGICARWAAVRAAFSMFTLGAGRLSVSSCKQ